MISTGSPYITPEHDHFRSRVRSYFESNISSHLNSWEERGEIPRETWVELGNKGYFGLHRPAEHGGSERDFFYSVVLLEEIGRLGYGGFRGAFSVHAYMATEYLALAGSTELKERYLGPAIKGQKRAALALTEPSAGSDLAGLRTSAVREGDSYVISGTKTFVTNGWTNDFIVAAVRTGAQPGPGAQHGAAGLSIVVIDRDSPSIEIDVQEKMGWHCSDTATIRFNRVQIPQANLVGSENHGFLYLMQCLHVERLAASIVALGEVDLCLSITAKYMASRKQFGSPLCGHQALRHRFADLVAEVEAARQLIYYVAWRHQAGADLHAECSMAKLRITDLAKRVADECLQFFGGNGYLSQQPISRLFRDMRLGAIVGGTNEIQREIIANDVFSSSAR